MATGLVVTPEEATDLFTRGVYVPTRAYVMLPLPVPATLPEDARQCASCQQTIIPIPAGWGTNWVPFGGGTGLCSAADNGVHWPPP
ncbi:hypothetical protein [Streptosporangium roseum]|uniref:hypothetical protein n=1 Tax=Streptosporangium roseum TaxID=2001 RepID=UPI0033205BD3